MYKESVGMYGMKEKFTRANPETMRDLLSEIGKRYVYKYCMCVRHGLLPVGMAVWLAT